MSKNTLNMILILLCAVSSAFAAVIYVDYDLNDGFWQDSHSTFQSALSVAQSGDEIWVAQGTYAPGMNREDSFVLKSGVKIYGGFFGGEISLDDRDIHNNHSILSGDIGIIGNASDNSYHVITYTGTLGTETLIDGFTIRDGYADDGNGGGALLLKSGASPLIQNCRFINNISVNEGGAASIENDVRFTKCLFDSNIAVNGGAVSCTEDRNQQGSAVFDHCTFVNNVAAIGSALYFEKRESAYVDSCVFWNNTNESEEINSLYLDTKVSTSTVTYSAFDDASIEAETISNTIHYTSSEIDGPFTDLVNYHLDNNHAIPREWGWYYVPAPLVLNIRVFLEGSF